MTNYFNDNVDTWHFEQDDFGLGPVRMVCQPGATMLPSFLYDKLDIPKSSVGLKDLMKDASHLVHIYAPSGSGKTRCMLEALAANYGFYIVGDTKGNGGSAVVKKALSQIKNHLCVDSHANNREICEKHVLLIILAYHQIFEWAERLTKKPTPSQWCTSCCFFPA